MYVRMKEVLDFLFRLTIKEMNSMSEKDQYTLAKQIISRMLEVFEANPDKYIGILLCEGTETSVDCKLYQAVYPLVLVIPVGGWSDVKRLHAIIKKKLKNCYPIYGMIDRDSRSKGEIKKLKATGIYCTKLPFIENVISCPEIVTLLAEEKGFNPTSSVNEIQKSLMHVLSQKLRDALPINIPIGEQEPLTSITIKIQKKNGVVIEKTVDEANIMYAYRDKAVANEAADVLRIVGRKNYYQFFIKCLDDEVLGPKLVKCAAKFLPIIELPDED